MFLKDLVAVFDNVETVVFEKVRQTDSTVSVAFSGCIANVPEELRERVIEVCDVKFSTLYVVIKEGK